MRDDDVAETESDRRTRNLSGRRSMSLRMARLICPRIPPPGAASAPPPGFMLRASASTGTELLV